MLYEGVKLGPVLTDPEIEQRRGEGRVEYVVSGQTSHSISLEELLAFVARVLIAVCRQPHQPA